MWSSLLGCLTLLAVPFCISELVESEQNVPIFYIYIYICYIFYVLVCARIGEKGSHRLVHTWPLHHAALAKRAAVAPPAECNWASPAGGFRATTLLQEAPLWEASYSRTPIHLPFGCWLHLLFWSLVLVLDLCTPLVSPYSPADSFDFNLKRMLALIACLASYNSYIRIEVYSTWISALLHWEVSGCN